jgi:hypothetical protein
VHGLLFALAFASASADRDWATTLRLDATALHDSIAANHPGPANPDDPGFADRNDAQLELALRRARTAKSFADYFYAMRQYVASFNDGHLEFGVFGNTPEDYRWPGFLTKYDSDGVQRVFVAEDWGTVPVGARLIGCDGKSADQVSAEIVGSIVGRWSLLSQRRQFGFLTFTNTTNPYVMHPSRCTFEFDGKTQTVELDWHPIDHTVLFKKVITKRETRNVDLRTLPDGTRWLTLPTFNGDPESDAGKRLTAILKQLDSSGDEVRNAPAVVLDLRGNGGGSSDWSYQIARRIWGEGSLAAVPRENVSVMWRASPANLETIRLSYEQRGKSDGLSSEIREWYEDTLAGLDGAIKAGQPVWRAPPDSADTNARHALARYRPKAKIILVTDASCMSACLDAVDLWRSLGAIHVGQETSADTLYMEVRQDRLPSKLGMITLPMKVYRGRSRGSNEPVKPHFEFPGDINDTDALAGWINTLH